MLHRTAGAAACGAVGGGLPGANPQIGDLGQLPAQREEQTELRYFCPFTLPRHSDITAACGITGLEGVEAFSFFGKYFKPVQFRGRLIRIQNVATKTGCIPRQ